MARNDKISYVFVLLAAALWGSTAAVAKLLLANLDGLQVLFFNNIFAFLGLLLVVIAQKKITTIGYYTKRDYFNFAWMGFLGVFLYTFFLLKALQFLPAQEAFIINYLWPVMVVIFAAAILKEQITLKKAAGIAISFFGVAVVIIGGNFANFKLNNPLGVLSAISGAVVYGLFSVLGKKQNYDKFISMMFYYFFSFFYALAAVLTFSKIPKISMGQLAGLVWLGVFTSGLAFVFWFLAIQRGDTAKMSSIIFLTPFISLVFIYFLIGEKILLSSAVGLMIIIAGILAQSDRQAGLKMRAENDNFK